MDAPYALAVATDGTGRLPPLQLPANGIFDDVDVDGDDDDAQSWGPAGGDDYDYSGIVVDSDSGSVGADVAELHAVGAGSVGGCDAVVAVDGASAGGGHDAANVDGESGAWDGDDGASTHTTSTFSSSGLFDDGSDEEDEAERLAGGGDADWVDDDLFAVGSEAR